MTAEVIPVRSVPLTEEERSVLASVDHYLAAGRSLKAWYDRAFALNMFEDQFDLARTLNRPERSFGFFDRIAIPAMKATIPVMGNYQEMYYDGPGVMADFSQSHAKEWLAQVREFVCHYFMRVSNFTDPTPYISSNLPDPSRYIGNLSWAVPPDSQKGGFGFSQLYGKRRDTGKIFKFPDYERFAIVDLRTLAEKYDWVVLKVRIFDFAARLQIFGAGAPELVANLNEESYLVIAPDFVIDESFPGPQGASSGKKPIARYGFGYAFLPNPERGFLAYGPGEFDVAFESIHFEVAANGAITVSMDFAANRPERVAAVAVNPARWTAEIADKLSMGMVFRTLPDLPEALEKFSLGNIDPVAAYISGANVITAGQAGLAMGISHEQIDKRFLLQHFTQHYKTIVGSLMTWRQIPNWLDADALPKWVTTGGLIDG